jgi:hypothetical protein
MTDTKPARTRNTTGPLACGIAADRIVALIATAPDEKAIAERIRATIGEEKRALQKKIDALAARVEVLDRGKLPKLVLALLDGTGSCGLCLFAANDLEPGEAEEKANDAAPADEVPELPRGAQPYTPGEVARAAERGRR